MPFKGFSFEQPAGTPVPDTPKRFNTIDSACMNRLPNAFLFLACLLTAATAFTQSVSVNGKVSGYNFGPLEGATVSVKGTSRSVITNNFGQFKDHGLRKPTRSLCLMWTMKQGNCR